MSYYHRVQDNKEKARVKKELRASGQSGQHMLLMGNKVEIYTCPAETDEICLTIEKDFDAVSTIFAHRLLGNDYDYENETCISKSELDRIYTLGSSMCGSISERKLHLSESEIRDMSFLQHCSNFTDISGIILGQYQNMFAMPKLEKVRLPETLTEIGNCAFAFCVALNDIVIPESVTNIKAKAFYNCLSLHRIEIPENVTNIGADAFAKSSALSEIRMKSSVPPTIYTDTFTGIASNCTVYVPKNSVSAYKAEWKSMASHIKGY